MCVFQSLGRIPANRYFKTHEEQFQSNTDNGATLRTARQHYRNISRSSLGPEDWRKIAALLLMFEKPTASAKGNNSSPTEHEIRTALVSSLEREPAHPLTWAYLADTDLRFGNNAKKALQKLEQSYRVAPLEPDFFFYRLGIALNCKQQWDIAILGHLRREIGSLFTEQGNSRNRDRFIELALSNVELRLLTRTLLRSNLKAFEHYQNALQEQH